MDRTHIFFGFFISYTILNFPLSVLCLPIMLLIPCTFSPYHLPSPFPADNPPNDLHIYDSVPVLLLCFLDSIVDSCEFIAILMFIVFIFFLHNYL